MSGQCRQARTWRCLWSPETRLAVVWHAAPIDYPAAHSMDTTWFAVDRDGYVAVGFSGETGCIPSDTADFDFFQLLRLLRGDAENEDTDDDDDPDWDDAMDEAFDRGFFLFNYIEGPWECLNPYRASGEPETPLHVDQLPPQLRKIFNRVRLDKVRFKGADQLQLIEHVPCFFYSEEEDVAYLGSDGKTVRPIPGREDKFPEFCEMMRQQYPDSLKRLTFASEGIAKQDKKAEN